MYQLDSPKESELAALLALWESSVRATHHFLVEDDIIFFKKIILEKDVLRQVNLTCARDAQYRIPGFMGVAEDRLEMLFIDPAYIGQGIGKLLLIHAIHQFHITRVDVNEQNEAALKFYTHFGFQVISRSALDGTGKPYPILHLQLQ